MLISFLPPTQSDTLTDLSVSCFLSQHFFSDCECLYPSNSLMAFFWFLLMLFLPLSYISLHFWYWFLFRFFPSPRGCYLHDLKCILVAIVLSFQFWRFISRGNQGRNESECIPGGKSRSVTPCFPTQLWDVGKGYTSTSSERVWTKCNTNTKWKKSSKLQQPLDFTKQLLSLPLTYSLQWWIKW